ncbi:hypothetical protein KI387_003139, partial [Taxus chinensis]
PAKFVLRIQCHRNCLGGSQFVFQRKHRFLRSNHYQSAIKRKTRRIWDYSMSIGQMERIPAYHLPQFM